MTTHSSFARGAFIAALLLLVIHVASGAVPREVAPEVLVLVMSGCYEALLAILAIKWPRRYRTRHYRS